MKKLALLLLFLIALSFIPTASAEAPDLSIFDIVRRAFAYGIDDGFALLGENIRNMTNQNASSILPDSLTKPRIDILKSPFLQQYSGMQAFIFKWGMIIYLLGGGTLVVLSNMKPSLSHQLHAITFVDRNILDLENFLKYFLLGIIIWIFADRGIEMLFALEGIAKSFITRQMIVFPPPIPTFGFAIFIDSLSWFLLAAYGIYSYLVVGIVLGIRYILFILIIFPRVGDVALSILSYAGLLLFSSVILLQFAWMGLAILQSSFIGIFISYFVLQWMLIIGSILIVFAPILYRWLFPSYKTIRMVI